MSVLSSLLSGMSGTIGVRSPWATTDLSPIVWNDLFPGTDPATLPLTREAALKVPAVARCHRLIISAMSSARLYAVTEAGDTPDGLAPPIVRNPIPGEAVVNSYARVVDHLMWYGVAYLEVTRRYVTDGKPLECRALHPRDVTWTADRPDVYSVAGRAVPYADVIRFDSVTDPLLVTAAQAIRDAVDIRESARRAGRNPVPSIELHQTSGDPLSSTAIDDLIRRWAAARAGRNGGVSYTGANIEVRTHGQPAQQLLIEGRSEAAREVARAMNMPSWSVDASVAGASMTYSNVESRTREILDYTLAPYLNAIAARLSLDDVLPRGTWARWDTYPLLMGDLRTRMEGYKTAIDAGIYSPDDVRRMESDRTPKENTQ